MQIEFYTITTQTEIKFVRNYLYRSPVLDLKCNLAEENLIV
jgi:hypothetical protein